MKNSPAWLLCLFLFICLQSVAQTRLPTLGVTTTYRNDSLLHAAGFDYIEGSVGKLLSPDIPEDSFLVFLRDQQKMHCIFNTCNGFIPAEIPIVGPKADEQKILTYVDKVMQRAKKAGVKTIVLGSGNARKLPEGWTPEKENPHFVSICRKIAETAAKYNVVIAIENLNSTETNYINTLADANAIVNAVNHPNFKLTADIYHMLKENEPAANIVKAKKNLVHCHIAEREKRTAPGVAGDEVRPYIAALANIHYNGGISVESRWDPMDVQAAPAQKYLRQLILELYH
ncbi:Sugar phosphate isomerase/epimerase [Chitinophaga sancti]|uniref:Sugar phosphate isomerase/epimerase n=1 Tax=Chitinophaga sancti TaxID=1004 RepID=A0A1K1QMF7_9BACT|nr:Sugar phosphate isomerase/epimerase [Chitinophaga sancti]